MIVCLTYHCMMPANAVLAHQTWLARSTRMDHDLCDLKYRCDWLAGSLRARSRSSWLLPRSNFIRTTTKLLIFLQKHRRQREHGTQDNDRIPKITQEDWICGKIRLFRRLLLLLLLLCVVFLWEEKHEPEPAGIHFLLPF